jgi:ATP-dependent Clp protease adaptor protein ClpS
MIPRVSFHRETQFIAPETDFRARARIFVVPSREGWLRAEFAAPIPEPEEPQTEFVSAEPSAVNENEYVVIGWNDPINLMAYVIHVLQLVFGWDKLEAEGHMLQMHQSGKSILARETMEKAEHYVHQLHKFGLHATMERKE